MNQSTTPKGKIIVFGILFYYPLAGVTYQFLHYLLGLRQLGFDPYYIEDSARWIYDPGLNDFTPDATGNIGRVLPALEKHGLADRWAFRGNYPEGQCHGMSEAEILELYRTADAFLNVTGAQEIREEHRACPHRIYVESDPFVSQVKVAQGDQGMIDMLEAHDHHFTFGEHLGAEDCRVPLERFDWQPTRQPVALDLWPMQPARPGAAYNTITTWHNKGKDIEYQGETWYWTKDREFKKFIELPQKTPHPFELATTVGPDVQAYLREHGWRQADSVAISSDADRYADYIQNSRGEFTVARDQYVRPRTGWFSDRSACYLAAGRPVITQETGFSRHMPSGRGLHGFATLEDILAAVEAIESDYDGHCRAARELAAEYFSADKVVGGVLQRSGLL